MLQYSSLWGSQKLKKKVSRMKPYFYWDDGESFEVGAYLFFEIREVINHKNEVLSFSCRKMFTFYRKSY